MKETKREEASTSSRSNEEDEVGRRDYGSWKHVKTTEKVKKRPMVCVAVLAYQLTTFNT